MGCAYRKAQEKIIYIENQVNNIIFPYDQMNSRLEKMKEDSSKIFFIPPFFRLEKVNKVIVEANILLNEGTHTLESNKSESDEILNESLENLRKTLEKFAIEVPKRLKEWIKISSSIWIIFTLILTSLIFLTVIDEVRTRAEAQRLVAEAHAEAERLAAEKRAEAERLAAEARADEVRLSTEIQRLSEMIDVPRGILPQSSILSDNKVSAFQIGKYEVALSLWIQVAKWAYANGYDLPYFSEKSEWALPVQSVNWYDAVKWCNARSEKENLVPVYEVGGIIYRTGFHIPQINKKANGFRLPTEAEWEWAARGASMSQEYAYSGSNDVDAVAWYSANSGGRASQVGKKSVNNLGIHDMSGNMWEWVWDALTPLDTYPIRRLRGGSWSSSATSCTIKYRNMSYMANTHSEGIGFRVARSLAP